MLRAGAFVTDPVQYKQVSEEDIIVKDMYVPVRSNVILAGMEGLRHENVQTPREKPWKIRPVE
jgi:hypothetical protein